MNKIFIALLSLFVASSALAAEGFSSFEEQMTGKEFTAAGLNKLTPGELAELNAWIRRHSLATLDTPKSGSTSAVSEEDQSGLKSADREDDKDKDKKRETITSSIDGNFTGWDGHTVFKLKNGQIWAQSDKDKFYTKEIENPMVNIEPGMFGVWRLHVEGYDKDCRVKRIQ